MPTVSVIIPTYKHRDFVLATLDSVFAQTFTDYEVIVVNDGSPDDTAEVLKPLVQARRIRYIEQANQGQAAARNRGLAEAQGEFVAFLDDDDLWPTDKLEWQVQTLSASRRAVLVYGYAETFGPDSSSDWSEINLPTGNVLEAFLKQNWITSPGQVLIRREALKKIGAFDPLLWGVDDWDLYIRLATIGHFVFVSTRALHYRFHTANASKNVSRMYENACRLADKHLKDYEMHNVDVPKKEVDTFYANQYIQAALNAKRLGNRKAIRKMLWSAARIQPSIVKERCFIAALAASLIPFKYASLRRVFQRNIL